MQKNLAREKLLNRQAAKEQAEIAAEAEKSFQKFQFGNKEGYTKTGQAAVDALKKSSQETSSVRSLQYGSNETISAINRARMAAKSHEQKVQSLLSMEVGELKKQSKKLDEIKKKLDGGGAIKL